MLGERTVDRNGIARRDAFDALAHGQLDASYRLAAVILGDPHEAQDATHDAFVAAWKGWPGLRDQARLEAWFGRILVNICRDRLRRARRRPVVDISDELHLTDGGDHVAAAADHDALDRGFARLSNDERIVVALRYYGDLTIDEIAVRVGVPPGTVKSRLHRAVRDLGVALAPDRPEETR